MRMVACVLVLGLALALAGCGTHDGSLAGFRPEGQGDSALLLADVQPISPSDSSQVVVYGVVYDSSTTNGFRLYVDPAGEGFRPATDFVSAPTHTFSTGVNEYRMRALIFDATPGVGNTYLARGARDGLESGLAPLTEPARVPGVSPVSILAQRVDVSLVAPLDSAMVDSIPLLSWAPVPGAARYLVRIIGRNGVTYLVIVNGTTHRVEGPDPVIRLEDLPMRSGLLYTWEVEAIDSANRLFGKTTEPRALLVD